MPISPSITVTITLSQITVSYQYHLQESRNTKVHSFFLLFFFYHFFFFFFCSKITFDILEHPPTFQSKKNYSNTTTVSLDAPSKLFYSWSSFWTEPPSTSSNIPILGSITFLSSNNRITELFNSSNYYMHHLNVWTLVLVVSIIVIIIHVRGRRLVSG